MDGDSPSARRAALERLAREMAHLPWFVAVGEPVTAAEAADVGSYLAALGLDPVPVAGVADWPSARRIADDPHWDRAWWDAEERLRAAALAEATAALGPEAAMAALTAVVGAASDVVHGAAAVAAARFGTADPALARSAAGAATQAAYLAALARAGGAGPGHAFAIKLRLFEGGRWPLGIVGGVYHLF